MGGGPKSAAVPLMKETDSHPDAAKLSALLREARVSPALPSRFQQNVWRRIEDAEAPAKPASWLDALAALILRPRLALTASVVLLVAGIFLGIRQGEQAARQEAQAHYLAAVAPNSLR